MKTRSRRKVEKESLLDRFLAVLPLNPYKDQERKKKKGPKSRRQRVHGRPANRTSKQLFSFLFLKLGLKIPLLGARSLGGSGIEQVPPKPPSFALLECFSRFCSEDDRDIVELLRDDLKRDVVEMRTEPRWKITWYVFKQSTRGAILPILLDSLKRKLRQFTTRT